MAEQETSNIAPWFAIYAAEDSSGGAKP